jgi:tRNA(Ile2) C34 agmatinyltransferase TiaS
MSSSTMPTIQSPPNCWNCGVPMEETGTFFTCPKCGSTDSPLPSPKDAFHPKEGQRETRDYSKKQPKKRHRLIK